VGSGIFKGLCARISIVIVHIFRFSNSIIALGIADVNDNWEFLAILNLMLNHEGHEAQEGKI
jgi:hypothetical protein